MAKRQARGGAEAERKGVRMCVSCGKVLPLSAFYTLRERRRSIRHSRECRSCVTTRSRLRYRGRVRTLQEETRRWRKTVVADRYVRAPSAGCRECAPIEQCAQRVSPEMGLPVLCEIIDQDDLTRARLMHGVLAEALLGIEKPAEQQEEVPREVRRRKRG